MPPRKRKSTSNNDCGQPSSNADSAIGCQTTGQVAKRAAMLRATSVERFAMPSAASSSVAADLRTLSSSAGMPSTSRAAMLSAASAERVALPSAASSSVAADSRAPSSSAGMPSTSNNDRGQASSSSGSAGGCQSTGQVAKRAAMLRAAYAKRVAMPSTASSSFAADSRAPGPMYADLGDCNNFCEYCGASFWFEECLKSSPQYNRPRYNMCCKAGAVRLHFPKDPPIAIKDLYSNPHFMANIRAYNSMFSMTSFGADIDNAINQTAGPYVFKVAGQISHWLGSLCPPTDANPRFLQMYVYDTENEVANRLRFFQDGDRQLSADIVAALTHVLAEVNEYVKLFKTAKDLCSSEPVPEFAITLFNSIGRNHEMPTGNCLGAIIHDDDPLASTYDIIIHSKEGVPKRVSKLHPSYMPLQYPLLFPFAEQGWSPELRLVGRAPPKEDKLTMNMFYAYQLHDRQSTYTLLLQAGRLFQQYLVDAYICIEQCRLDYIRANQNRFCSEYLRGIHDAFQKGDTEGQQVGQRTILPSSFIGGPRYMYKHYQDALAICWVHGNPQYFITFTCNVRWPEIKRCLVAAGCPNAQDRPDIIARVFQMKVTALRNFLKTQRAFGTVAADLYTIEFQKRGLPHCHMLLWVTPENKIRDAKDEDRFISAEIPNSAVDPTLASYRYRINDAWPMRSP